MRACERVAAWAFEVCFMGRCGDACVLEVFSVRLCQFFRWSVCVCLIISLSLFLFFVLVVAAS